MQRKSTMKLACWASVGESPLEGECFVHDSVDLPESLERLAVVLESGTAARANELLARGAGRVLLGDLALLDSTALERLVEQHGPERIGIWLAVKKSTLSWTLDKVAPNAGFRCMMPSMGVPGWDVLKSDGSSSGTDAEWWVGQMLALGASMAVISVDMQDDDLNVCAGLIEQHGEKLWFTTRKQPDADLEPWVRWGQVRQLILPKPNKRDEEEMLRICAAAMVEIESPDDESCGDQGTVEGQIETTK